MTTFDPTTIEEAFGDDREGLTGFVRSVGSSIRNGYERVQDAAARGDVEEVRQAAHALKGSCGHIGGAEVATIAERFETRARAGAIESAAALEELAAAIGRLEAAIEAYAVSGAPPRSS